MKPPKRIPKKTREHIRERDNCQCQMCGRATFEIHHIISAGMGCRKDHSEENLIMLCKICHFSCHNGPNSEELQRWCEDWSREKYGSVIDKIKERKWKVG